MFMPSILDLRSIATLAPAGSLRTRSICAENPDGRAGGGGMAEPMPEADGRANPARYLGRGWKARPCITLDAGETATLADVAGPGIIQHIWITCRPTAYRTCILRMYWDDEETPSVEVPLGDFFCCGHARRTLVNSLPLCVNPVGGFNSYWPMPFGSRCRITVENQHSESIRAFFFQITYAEMNELPADAGRFHAQWRRSMTTREYPEHVILDGVTGRGHYAGTYLAWAQLSNGWWGEGEVKFFLDGDSEYPTICGTGTEDYFGGAWCFAEAGEREHAYSTPFLGLPLVRQEPNEVPEYGMYRWHIPDPVYFDERVKVTVQALGWWPDHRFQPLTDDIASVAYWYQSEPHGVFPVLPGMEGRWPR